MEQPHGYGSGTGAQNHISIAPFIGIFAAVVVLGAAAVVVGRVCSGRRGIAGGDHPQGKYDLESWAERKCSSCIDGRIHFDSQSGNAGSEKDLEQSVTTVGATTESNLSPGSCP
ncbi:hypothetical protein MLD38_000723 [Melastoma candidum]|uniref:Uncharacterized protein n=1 Tax=Melastoma candidum TaxID=119954 RepID=A0ACB9SB25_9MYRT|nr:hypothetical protein MLD38_000723 [Melastoma candidum]